MWDNDIPTQAEIRLAFDIDKALWPLYPIEAAYHAPYVMHNQALEDGLITRAEWDVCKKAIGNRWNYVGD